MSGTEPEQVAALIGTAGMAEGEAYVLADAVEIVIGRSRSCPVSLRRATNYLRASPAVRDSDHDFNTVSRRHLRIFVAAGKADLEDLSSNGTFVAGEPLTGRTTVDLTQGPCSLRLGTRERFDLLLLAIDDPRIAGKAPLAAATSNSDD
jgi:pSer/pThr/pTyr-binding forkhead associated (FHA) protein